MADRVITIHLNYGLAVLLRWLAEEEVIEIMQSGNLGMAEMERVDLLKGLDAKLENALLQAGDTITWISTVEL